MFDDREYTQEALIKQLGLIELHSKDGSAIDAGCQCIETKHLFNIEGLSEEGQGFAMSEKERRFYEDLANMSRLIRKDMEVETYEFASILGEFQTGNAKRKGRRNAYVHMGNPFDRKFLPRVLTKCEKRYPSVQKKLSTCIEELEPQERAGKITSSVAVCRHSIPCPP